MIAKRFTILVHARGSDRMRRFGLSGRLVSILAASTAVVLAAAILAPQLFVRSRRQHAEVDQLRRTNAELLAQKNAWDDRLDGIVMKLDRFEATADVLARELGLDPLLPPAVGGESLDAARTPLALQEADSLGLRADQLDDSLDAIGRAFEQRSQQLAGTPNLLPVEGWFSHGFGWRKDPWTGVREFHRGLDIVADAGLPILATADGVVSRSTRVSDYGNTIDISHSAGYVTRYAHMSKILVKTGQAVQRGDVVGLVGSTGRSTGPHLHYEVFRDGRRVNPWKYLGRR